MYTTRRGGFDREDARLHYEQLQRGKHNTPEANEAFREAFDATNTRWKAAVAQDSAAKKDTK
jgi:hypothetical protein